MLVRDLLIQAANEHQGDPGLPETGLTVAVLTAREANGHSPMPSDSPQGGPHARESTAEHAAEQVRAGTAPACHLDDEIVEVREKMRGFQASQIYVVDEHDEVVAVLTAATAPAMQSARIVSSRPPRAAGAADRKADEASRESFPASDAPAH
jgi:hypothetical protein